MSTPQRRLYNSVSGGGGGGSGLWTSGGASFSVENRLPIRLGAKRPGEVRGVDSQCGWVSGERVGVCVCECSCV